jgi:succinate dehydrogenase / fumarate reductase cytochrome b subunit
MTTNRPVFLDLWRIKLPISGVVSILHRVSGVLMVLSIPIFTVLFARAVSGPQGFAAVAAFLDHALVRLALLVMAWAVLHHLLAGIRYLIIDLGIGVDRPTARKSAFSVVGAAVGLALVVGGGMLL